MTTFHLPDLGEGLTEAEIIAWHVSPGDRVLADQPLVSVETDKAVVEIPAPSSGVIRQLYGEPGEIVAVGARLVDLDDGATKDAGALVGELPRELPAPPRAMEDRAAPELRAVRAVPAVRALADELGVDLRSLTGSGPGGTITSRDVEAASGSERARSLPLRGVRRSMAKAMARARSEVVPATVHDWANIDHWPPDADPTLRLIRAVLSGVAAEPGLNAWFDSAREALTLHAKLDLGIALDRPEGLYVPVIRDVAKLDERARRSRLDALEQAVRDRSIARADLSAPTLTLSNFGMIAGRHGSLVVVPPQVAILGAGRIGAQAVVQEGEVRTCRMLPLSLTFDHRVVTGGEAGRFLAAAITDLEDREPPQARA